MYIFFNSMESFYVKFSVSFVHFIDMYGFYIFVLFINLNYVSSVFMDIFIR